MNRLLIYIVLSFLAFTFSMNAQDDSEEDTANEPIFKEELLDEEKNYLDFKHSFIESLRYKAIENHEQALESLSICERIYPDNVAMLFESAKNHFAIKQFAEAHYYCDKALSIEKDNFWITALSRDIYKTEQNYPEALKLQELLYKKKKSEAGNLLSLYYRMKKNKKAKALLAEIENKNIYVLALDFYKNYYSSANKITPQKNIDTNLSKNRSLENLKTEFSQTNNFKVLLRILEKEKESKDFTALFKDSDTGLSLFPAQAKMYLYKGIALNGLKKHKEAISVLEYGLDFVFDNTNLKIDMYNALIHAYNAVNNIKKVNHYRQMVQKLRI